VAEEAEEEVEEAAEEGDAAGDFKSKRSTLENNVTRLDFHKKHTTCSQIQIYQEMFCRRVPKVFTSVLKFRKDF